MILFGYEDFRSRSRRARKITTGAPQEMPLGCMRTRQGTRTRGSSSVFLSDVTSRFRQCLPTWRQGKQDPLSHRMTGCYTFARLEQELTGCGHYPIDLQNYFILSLQKRNFLSTKLTARRFIYEPSDRGKKLRAIESL